MKYLCTLLFVFLLAGCAANNAPADKSIANTNVSKAQQSSRSSRLPRAEGGAANKQIIGSVEAVRLLPPDVVIHARIDTGAATTSIDAREIMPFERDGKPWVRFLFVADGKKSVIEKPVERRVRIKQHDEETPESRYVVRMRLVLGNTSQIIPVSLADRSRFKYPVLIGRNFLRDIYIVDVAKKLSTTPRTN